MGDRHAVVVTTAAAAAAGQRGASIRLAQVLRLLEQAGFDASVQSQVSGGKGRADLGVIVSYARLDIARRLRAVTDRLWLDAVDSWRLLDGSGVKAGRASYAARWLRDLARVSTAGPADLVTYCSAADLKADRGSVRGGAYAVLPLDPDVVGLRPSKGEGCRVVLAGDWSYPPNADGLRWFTRDVLPHVERCRPPEPWHVAVFGPGARQVSPRMRVQGYAADRQALYQRGDVHAAPVRFGAGVKLKVVQPLLLGLPVVTTPSGANGLSPTPLLSTARRAEDFAASLCRRLHEPPADLPSAPHSSELVDRDDTDTVRRWLDAARMRPRRPASGYEVDEHG